VAETEHAHRLAARRLHDAPFEPLNVARPALEDLVTPQPRIARRVHQRALSRDSFELQHEVKIGLDHLPQNERFGLPFFERRDGRRVTDAAAAQVHGHLVAKLPVVVRDARDRLHLLPAFRAQRVHDIELKADQPALAIFGRGAHELHAADPKRNAAKGPGLRDQVEGGNDAARVLLGYDREVMLAERWVASAEQLARPFGDGLVRLRHAGIAVHPLVEVGQRLRIRAGREAQHQSVPQVAGQAFGNGDLCAHKAQL